MADNPKITHLELNEVVYAFEDAEAARQKDFEEHLKDRGSAPTVADLAAVTVETDNHERRIASLETLTAEIRKQARYSELAEIAAESDTHERRLDAAERDIQALQEDVEEKASTNDTAMLFVSADDHERRLEQLESDSASLREDVDIKADTKDLVSALLDLDEHNQHLSQLDEQILTKANAHDLETALAEVDIHGLHLNRLDGQMTTKADSNDLAAATVALDVLRNDTEKALITKANANDLAGVAADLDVLTQHAATEDSVQTKGDLTTMIGIAIETDALQTAQTKLSNSVRDLRVSVSDVISQKVNAPKSTGVQGQVLTTQGDGTTLWTDPSSPTDEQIGSAVETWLEDHPEATTTVADGSITTEKLSQEVKDLIGTGEDKDAQALIQSVYSELGARMQMLEDPYEESAKFETRWAQRLREHASRYADPGFGFMFFTDPHNLTWRFEASQRSLLKDMDYLHRIYEQTPAKYVFCGGDWLNTEQISLEEAARLVGRVHNLMRTRIGPDAWTVYGNHDDNSESGNGAATIKHPHLARMWYGTDKLYRVLDAGEDLDIYLLYADYAMMMVSDEEWQEIAWLAAKLQANTKPHLFGIGHMLYSEDSIYFGDALCSLLNAFNQKTSVELNGVTYDFSGSVGTWHFMIGGHEHNDIVRTHMNIPLIITDNFFWVNEESRVVDLCYADWTKATLYLDRIGKGNSRTVPIIPTGGYQASN